MNKDEMKNRISLALKDPILQQGFEIICKNLAELKKENAELKELEKENEKLMQMLASSSDCETCKHYDEDLEKEDKEPCKNCFYDNSFWELKED